MDVVINIQSMATIMTQKKLIMLGMAVGSIAGGYLPALFWLDELMISLLGSFIGGIIGIWIGYKFSV
ncbi:MAG: hypothetical protein ABIJ57_15355 [Pseudomonadota bacterium]